MPFFKLVLVCLVNLLLYESPLVSQELKTTGTGCLMAESRVYYGYIYAHHKQLDYLYARFPSYEISIEKQTSGMHEWERCYNLPIIGLSFYYSGFGNSPVISQVYALMPFINFPLVKNDRFATGIRLATGIGYFPHPYDPVENPMNVAICTHLNAAINIMLEARYRLSKQFDMTGGISFQHFSNGGWKEPNYGLNIPMVSIGFAYHPLLQDTLKNNCRVQHSIPMVHHDTRRIVINTGAGIGYKERVEELGQNFVIYHLYENTCFPVSRKSMFGFGFDLSYDPSIIKTFKVTGTTVDKGYRNLMTGINAVYVLVVAQLEIQMNLGIYTGKVRPDGPLYEKLALQYNFSRHFFAQVMLKAHLTAADYITWSGGYRFNLRYGRKNTVKEY